MADASTNSSRSLARHLRVGLQTKCVLIVTFVVVAVTAAGGWFYFGAAGNSLRNSDLQHAGWMGQSLSLAAQKDLAQGRDTALGPLASGFLRNGSVLYVTILNEQGQVVASASQTPDAAQYQRLNEMPVTVSATYQESNRRLVLVKPILTSSQSGRDDKVIGAIRLVIDTSSTAESLIRVQQRMGIIAAAIVLCGMPLGYILVWRTIIQPIRRLVRLTRQLAAGDFTARAAMRRQDEVGELSSAFDSMAQQTAQARELLVQANERLEQKVVQRTEELVQTNLRLRDEIAEREDFLRAVSHDLNAPLRNIAGMATMILLKWRPQLPEDVVGRLQRIQANAEAESMLIAELMDLAQIRSRPEKRVVVQMHELITAVAATLEFEIKNRNIVVKIHCPMPALYVEPNRMRQVFQNLIDNAIKYMHRPTGGRIDIGYRLMDGQHVFFVQDNGPGIPADEHQRIFYVFRRCQNADAATIEGKGVGLAVVKSVAANYEGTASVQSEVGSGATFLVSLSAHCTAPPRNECSQELQDEPNVYQTS